MFLTDLISVYDLPCFSFRSYFLEKVPGHGHYMFHILGCCIEILINDLYAVIPGIVLALSQFTTYSKKMLLLSCSYCSSMRYAATHGFVVLETSKLSYSFDKTCCYYLWSLLFIPQYLLFMEWKKLQFSILNVCYLHESLHLFLSNWCSNENVFFSYLSLLLL